MLLASVVVIAAVAAGVVAGGTPKPGAQPGAILVRPLDVPFTAAGAVFNIARTRTSPWAVAVRRRELPRGHKWITLAAQSRNVGRANFHPRARGYRLRTSSGIVIGPATAMIPPELLGAGGRLPVGQRTSVHLGFQVPNAKTDLSLEFDPGPGSTRIRVPLN